MATVKILSIGDTRATVSICHKLIMDFHGISLHHLVHFCGETFGHKGSPHRWSIIRSFDVSVVMPVAKQWVDQCLDLAAKLDAGHFMWCHPPGVGYPGKIDRYFHYITQPCHTPPSTKLKGITSSVRPSVRLWTESYPLSNFHNTSRGSNL